MLKSKRFISLIVSVLIFIIGVFFFDCKPLELAGGITAIFTPYVVSQSLRKSDKNGE